MGRWGDGESTRVRRFPPLSEVANPKGEMGRWGDGVEGVEGGEGGEGVEGGNYFVLSFIVSRERDATTTFLTVNCSLFTENGNRPIVVRFYYFC